jgi:hypothetical protein
MTSTCMTSLINLTTRATICTGANDLDEKQDAVQCAKDVAAHQDAIVHFAKVICHKANNISSVLSTNVRHCDCPAGDGSSESSPHFNACTHGDVAHALETETCMPSTVTLSLCSKATPAWICMLWMLQLLHTCGKKLAVIPKFLQNATLSIDTSHQITSCAGLQSVSDWTCPCRHQSHEAQGSALRATM